MTPVVAESMLAAALGYLVRRWFPMPLCWPDANGACSCGRGHAPKDVGKAPLVSWKRLVKTPPTERDIGNWWTTCPCANVGLLLEPSGLLVIDQDSHEAALEATQRGLPPGPHVTTGKGHHRYYKAPPGLSSRSTKRGEARALDILAAGYIVAPPSIHRTGRPYSWVTPPGSLPLPLAPAWSVAMLAERPLKSSVVAATLPPNLPTVDMTRLRVPGRIQQLILHGREADPDRYVSRSEAVFATVRGLVKAGCDDATIASILLDPRHRISEKPLQHGGAWTAGEIARARAKGAPARDTSRRGARAAAANTPIPPSPVSRRSSPTGSFRRQVVVVTVG